MDEIHEYQKLQSYGYGDHHYSIVANKSNNNYNKYQYLLRRTLQVVVSVTILSFFYCYSHGVSFFPHSFSVYFSTFLFSLFTRTLERKYMFLICNGILVFLAKTSVSSGDYISSCLDQTTINSAKTAAAATTAVVVEEHQVLESNSADHDVIFEEEATDQDEQAQQQEADLEQVIKCADQDDNNEGGDLSLIMNSTTLFDDDENENANDDDGGSDYNLSKQEASNYDEELISTDELNKKIEEFIRKMKEEIRVEAQQQQQQQLIAV